MKTFPSSSKAIKRAWTQDCRKYKFIIPYISTAFISLKCKFLFFNNFIHLLILFIYLWLCWVFIAAQAFLQLKRAGATLRCSACAAQCGGFSGRGAWALGAQASVVAVPRLQSPGSGVVWHTGLVSLVKVVPGIFLQGFMPGRLFTTEPPVVNI